MNLPWLQIFLGLHLVGLTMFAGTMLTSYVVDRTFWKQLPQDKSRATALLGSAAKFQRFIGIGAALLILTGLGMMILTQGVFGQMLWFRIKFAIVIILIINGLVFGRRLGMSLGKSLQQDLATDSHVFTAIRSKFGYFYTAQLLLILTVITLSALKFA